VKSLAIRAGIRDDGERDAVGRLELPDEPARGFHQRAALAAPDVPAIDDEDDEPASAFRPTRSRCPAKAGPHVLKEHLSG
jgi:hypothetical protein